MPKSRRPTDPRLADRHAVIDFSNQPVIDSFTQAIKDGGAHPECNEIFAFGTRGDGKTIGVMVGMIEHAQMHHATGFPLPVPWMGVTDTFVSHKLKTIRSLENPLWQGGWKLTDQDHTATFWMGRPSVPLVKIDLFGIEDQGAKDKLRMESVGLWFEEPAPSAVMVQSSGIDQDSWMLGLTSLRIPSHFHPAVVSENYPDEDHWTWQRANPTHDPVFAHPAQFRALLESVGESWPVEFDKYPEGTPFEMCIGINETAQWFRVPCGERASEVDRLSWASSLKARPDLLRRLILGQPGVVMLGDQVAKGFLRTEHTTRKTLPFMRGEAVYMGFDFGNTPTCIIGQPNAGTMLIKAGLFLTNSGMQQLIEEKVLPWLARYAPWVLENPDSMAVIGFDPSQGTMIKPKGAEADIENAALMTIMRMLGGGDFEGGPVAWAPRREAITNIFRRAHGLMIEENDHTIHLIRALDGRWYYAKSHSGDLRSDNPKKPNHPWEDLGDALIYLLCRYGVSWQYHESYSKEVVMISNMEH
jgi:hypothetical protein